MLQVLLESLRLALGTFWGNRVHSLLTVLGVILGVATTVAMMGITEGMRQKVNRDLLVLGADVFEVARPPTPAAPGRGPARRYGLREDLTLADMRAIRDACPSAAAVSATQYKADQKVVSGTAETLSDVLLLGTTSEWSDTSGARLRDGRFFTEAEVLDGRHVAVLGAAVAERLFPSQEALGKVIHIRGQPLTVVGLLQRRGSMVGIMNMDNQVLLPLPLLRQLYGKIKYLEIDVQAQDLASFEQAQEEVTGLLRVRRGLRPQDEEDFDITTSAAGLRTFNQITRSVSAVGGGVCLLSLLVGGIGILNIMLVSVTQRVAEIGIRKALGARSLHILAQFALEAVVLSCLGGLVGVVLGGAVVLVARWGFGLPAVVQPWVVGLALGMSSAVGLIFGLYPAARAARLDPIEAMGFE